MQIIDLLTMTSRSFLRPPYWRWSLARELRNKPHPQGYRRRFPEDSWVDASLFIQYSLDDNATDEDRENAFVRVGPYGSDAYAFRHKGLLSSSAGTEEDKKKEYPIFSPLTSEAIACATLEAMILADKTPEEIGEYVGLHPDSIVLYEKWWLDVRDRLKYPGWIASQVIGSLHQGDPGVLIPAIIKAYGYYEKRTDVIHAASSTFSPTALMADGGNLTQFFAKDALMAGSLKAALAMRLMPLGKKTYARIAEIHNDALDTHAKMELSSGGTAAQDTYNEATKELLSRLRHGYGMEPTESAPLQLEQPHLTIMSDEIAS